MENAIIGQTITGILMGEKQLVFETRNKPVKFMVSAGCCSQSYFFDFYGVKNLLGSVVTKFERVELTAGDVGYHAATYDVPVAGEKGMERYSHTQVYGYRLITEHPVFGEVSSVFSFRNDSNGYYGGDMTLCEDDGNAPPPMMERLTSDKIG